MEFISCFKSGRSALRRFRLAVALFCATQVMCAQSYSTEYIWYYSNTGEVFFKTNPMNSDNTGIKEQVFNLTDCEYIVRNSTTVGEYERHFLCDLYYKGVKAEGYEFAVHIVGDSISGTGRLVSDGWNLSVVPVINQESAISAATSHLNSELYYWQNNDAEALLKEITDDPDATYYPAPLLCIFNGSLCYKLRIYSEIPLVTVDYFIDANTGDVAGQSEMSASACFDSGQERAEQKTPMESECSEGIRFPVENCMTCAWVGCHTGDADLLYYGNKSLDFEQFRNNSQTCWQRTKDFCNSALLYVKNGRLCSSSSNCANANSFSGGADVMRNTTSLSWGTNDQFATSALWCVKRAYTYYSTVHSRASYNDANGALQVLANDHNRPGNAGWLPNGEILVGNAGGGCGGHMTTIDVLTHEMTHGVIQQTANFPNFGEPGALNEGICDIFANHADFFTKQNISTGQAQNYLMFDEACSGGARDLSNPNSKSMPDTYLGTSWASTTDPNTNGGRHTNMGVIGFWYFLLSEGSNGPQTNDNSHTFCVKPIGRDKVVKVLYRALKHGYYTSSLTFSDLRSKTILAARDEFGYWSPEVAEMEAAFHAIGVGYNGNSGANTDPPFAVSYLPFVHVGSKTESGTKQYHFNNNVKHHDYVVAVGADIEVTAGDESEINLSPFWWDSNKAITIEEGSTYWGHLQPACSTNGLSGARFADSGDFQPDDKADAPENVASDLGESGLVIIPNPFQTGFTVQFLQTSPGRSAIEIVDVVGSTIYRNTELQNNRNYIDMGVAAAGVYLIKVTHNGKTYTKRLVKN